MRAIVARTRLAFFKMFSNFLQFCPYIYIYIYILFEYFEEKTILKGGEPPLDETRCEKIVIKKVFHLTLKENI